MRISSYRGHLGWNPKKSFSTGTILLVCYGSSIPKRARHSPERWIHPESTNKSPPFTKVHDTSTRKTLLSSAVVLHGELTHMMHFHLVLCLWGHKKSTHAAEQAAPPKSTAACTPLKKPVCYEILSRAGFAHAICCHCTSQRDHTRAHTGRESSRSPALPRCDRHLALHKQPVLGTVTWTAAAAGAFFTKEPPWWQPHVLLATGNVLQHKLLQNKRNEREHLR